MKKWKGEWRYLGGEVGYELEKGERGDGVMGMGKGEGDNIGGSGE